MARSKRTRFTPSLPWDESEREPEGTLDSVESVQLCGTGDWSKLGGCSPGSYPRVVVVGSVTTKRAWACFRKG